MQSQVTDATADGRVCNVEMDGHSCLMHIWWRPREQVGPMSYPKGTPLSASKFFFSRVSSYLPLRSRRMVDFAANLDRSCLAVKQKSKSRLRGPF